MPFLRLHPGFALLSLVLVSTAIAEEGALSGTFTPPAEFAGDLGEFRSPLLFNDGSEVRSAEDWNLRREEIRSTWHGLMGEWPPLITEPVVEMLESVKEENFTRHQIRFLWTPKQKTTGYLFIPDKATEGPLPAVLTVYYEPETAAGMGNEHRDFAYQLAKRGFVTLSIGTKEASEAKEYSLYWPSLENATVEPLSMLAYAAANAWHVLAARPEVDPERIGVTGHSFGGKWAMFASCLFDKFACAAWSDPGIVFDTRPSVNYWEPWYLGYHPKPWRERAVPSAENPARGLYPRLLAEGRDLHELHALMAPRPFFVSGGSEDPPARWRALNHSIAVNRLLAQENRVAMHNRPDHAPNPESNELIYSFFERELNPARQTVETLPAPVAAKTDNLNDKFWLYLPKRYAESKEKLPLIIFLHGSSRRGRDIELLKANGLPPVLDGKDDFEFIVASPQALSNYPWQVSWRPDDIALLLDHLLASYRIDPDRVYLTGLSMGGYGTWAGIAAHPDRFAAAAPICGGGDPESAKTIGALPIWAFHGDADEVVPVERSLEMVAAVNAGGGNAKLTLYPGVGHDSHTRTYADPELYRWFLTHSLPRARSAER